jgi:hypothetical protein
LIFYIKFNFQNLGKENKNEQVFLFIEQVFWFIDRFLFKIQILNEKGKLTGFLVYHSIFPVFIFSNFLKF